MKKILLILTVLATATNIFAVEIDHWYTLKYSTRTMLIENGSMLNGANIVMWTQTNVPSQVWCVEDAGDGQVYLRSGYQDKYLCTYTSAKAGAKIVARNSSSKSRLGTWELIPVEGKDNTYNIATKDGSLIIAIEENAEGVQPTLVDATAPTGKYEWKFVEYTKNVSTEYDEATRDNIVTSFMSRYYKASSNGHVLGEGGWWGDAEMFETILDGFETTGDKKYQTYASELIKDFLARNGSDWTRAGQGWPRYNEFNDDITWMCLALLRSYKYFKTTNHLTVARDNFDKMWARAIQPGGTLRWSQNASDHGTNSCINCPAIIAACYLYELTGEEDYLTKAKNLWDAQYNTLCDKNDGHVWDSGEWNSDFSNFTVGNWWGSTYNQGTMLGASIKLYEITGQSKYKNYADKVYNWSYNSLTSSDAAYLHIINACQTADGDLCGFKGILVRYVRMYGEEFGKEAALTWLEDCAWVAAQNANSKGIIWSKWLSKTSENFKSVEGNETKDFSNHPFGCSTAVSCALNAHVNRVFNKDAYSVIGCEMLDDAKWMQVESVMSDGDTPNSSRASGGAWICFKNVKFGSSGAKSLTMRFKGAEGSSYKVYIDKVTEDNAIATINGTASEWADYHTNLSKTVTGTHKVYVVSEGSTGAYFHNVIFSEDEFDPAGITEVEANINKDNAIYDIMGRRVQNPGHGLYIINGKKVMLK